jgi:hypothetical protein
MGLIGAGIAITKELIRDLTHAYLANKVDFPEEGERNWRQDKKSTDGEIRRLENEHDLDVHALKGGEDGSVGLVQG